MKISFRDVVCKTPAFSLQIDAWEIQCCESWTVFNSEGDAGSVLGDLLCGSIGPHAGSLSVGHGNVAQVSLIEQQRLLEDEIAHDDTDFLDRIDKGTSVYELIKEQCDDEATAQRLIRDLDLEGMADEGFRALSTGESRRVMLGRALAQKPGFLVLDEPYAGLDVEHRDALSTFLAKYAEELPMLVIVSREEDMPEWIDHIALFDRGCLEQTMLKSEWNSHPVIAQLSAQSETRSKEMVELIQRYRHQPQFSDPLFELRNGRVAYAERTIFSGVNWRINRGEHWLVKGPNGCGKSTLLGLIFGDHPQCYSNDIQIFGKQRGAGETIWEIKKHIGMVSSAIHLQYRVDCSAKDVLLSGFYDSIGLYHRASVTEIQRAEEWLELLHMKPFAQVSFRKLEYGQQRLLLIARALVKQPALLILDEPYQGLDFLSRRLMKNTLELIAQENLAQLLFVSHYQDDFLPSIHQCLEFIPGTGSNGYSAVIKRI